MTFDEWFDNYYDEAFAFGVAPELRNTFQIVAARAWSAGYEAGRLSVLGEPDDDTEEQLKTWEKVLP